MIRFNPPFLSEANAQAELYHQLKLLGIQCYLEYRSWWSGIRWDRKGRTGMRWDAVIVKNGQIVAIVEVKYGKYTLERWEITKQCQKYNSVGIPVFLLIGMEDVERVKTEIIKLLGGL